MDERAVVNAGGRPGRARSPVQRWLLILFIISPLVVVTGLCVMIMRSLGHEKLMSAPPIGAGAGKTGMSNEYTGIGKQPDGAAKKPVK
jgi:hypothetical protein